MTGFPLDSSAKDTFYIPVSKNKSRRKLFWKRKISSVCTWIQNGCEGGRNTNSDPIIRQFVVSWSEMSGIKIWIWTRALSGAAFRGILLPLWTYWVFLLPSVFLWKHRLIKHISILVWMLCCWCVTTATGKLFSVLWSWLSFPKHKWCLEKGPKTRLAEKEMLGRQSRSKMVEREEV